MGWRQTAKKRRLDRTQRSLGRQRELGQKKNQNRPANGRGLLEDRISVGGALFLLPLSLSGLAPALHLLKGSNLNFYRVFQLGEGSSARKILG